MTKNYLFDLGGVLINYDLAKDTEALQAVGLPLYSQWNQYPELKRIADDYLNGLLPSADFYQQIRPYCHAGVTDQEIEYSMIAVMADLPKSRLEHLVNLRKHGYKVYLLSNINEPTWNYAVSQFAVAGYRVEDCFNEVFLSYQLQMAKPGASIFEHVIAQTGINPAETIYYDDDAKNIQTGIQLGFQACLVEMNNFEKSY